MKRKSIKMYRHNVRRKRARKPSRFYRDHMPQTGAPLGAKREGSNPYADTAGLRLLGAGGYRVVYDLGDGTVLKVARNSAGKSDNLTEAAIGSRGPRRDVVAPVFDFCRKGEWLVMKKAKFIDPATFETMTGYAFGTFERLVDYHLRRRIGGDRLTKPEHKNLWSSPVPRETDVEDEYENIQSPWVLEMLDFISDEGICDYGKIEQYGILDGRVVMVDYSCVN